MKHKFSLRERLKYKIDYFMSRGGYSTFIALLILFIISFIVMSAIRLLVDNIISGRKIINVSSQLWRVFLQITDAGALIEDGDSQIGIKVIATITILIGLILFSSLVAFISNIFEVKMSQLRKGKSQVIEVNHTLILGFGERVLEIVKEIIVANSSKKYAVIVVLSEYEKDYMDEFFRVNIKNLITTTTKLITRTGSISSLLALKMVNVDEAKSIIILNPVGIGSDNKQLHHGDARVIKSIMAIASITGKKNMPSIVAEVHTRNMRKIAGRISSNIVVFEENLLLAKMMVQFSRISALALVYENLLGFSGDEFYFFKPNEGWNSLSYEKLMFKFRDCSVIGYRDRNGKVNINPDSKHIMSDDEFILLISEDDSTIDYDKNRKVLDYEEKYIPLKKIKRNTEKYLIIGWNRKTTTIVRKLCEFIDKGSEIVILVSQSTDIIADQMKGLKGSNKGINIRLIKGDLYNLNVFNKLRIERFDGITILKKDGKDAELFDSETIGILLEIQNYFSLNKVSDLKTRLITEVADPENVDVIQNIGVKDYLVSSKFVSRIYAQVSEDINILNVFNELFKQEGSEIYIKPFAYYSKTDHEELTFEDLCLLALNRKESCFGVRIKKEENDKSKNYGVYINPGKDKHFYLTKNDCLITVAEDEW